MKTRALQQKKSLQPYFTEGGTFTCAYHPKKKIPELSCITDDKMRTTYIQSASTLARQPSNKGRKRVIFREPDHATTPAAYALNLNTSHQEILRLHETYAHAYMKEIQQQKHHGSITQNDNHPGSNTSIDHVDAYNVSG
jgi:hypothetical protein